MGLLPALLVLAALGVLAFGVITAGRAEARKGSSSDQLEDSAGRGGVCIKLIWAGLGLFVAGLVACVLAYNWQVPYSGPLTGLGPGLALAAALCVMGLGVIVVLVALVVAAGGEARRRRAAEKTSAEALPGNDGQSSSLR